MTKSNEKQAKLLFHVPSENGRYDVTETMWAIDYKEFLLKNNVGRPDPSLFDVEDFEGGQNSRSEQT